MEQKVIISKTEYEVNNLLSQGWKVVSVTAQHVAICGSNWHEMNGNFCFVLEREITIE